MDAMDKNMNGGGKPDGEKRKDLNKSNKPGGNGLNLVRRGLYARQEPEQLKSRQEELRRLGVTRHPVGESEEDKQGSLAMTKYKNLALMRAKRLGKVIRFSGVMLLVVFLTIWGIVATVWYSSRQKVTDSQIVITVEAPQEFTAGEEIIYKLDYGNQSRVDWQNVEIVFTPPRGFSYRGSSQEVETDSKQIVLKVGELPSAGGGDFQIRGQLTGEEGETAVASAELFLTPVNFPSGKFVKKALMATSITALPLEVALNWPSDAASGERVIASLSIRNLSSQTLNNVYLKVSHPEGVAYAVEDDDFTDGFSTVSSEWEVGSIEPLKSEDFSLVFYLEGQPGEKRHFDIVAGIRQGNEDFVQRELTHIVSISEREVLVEQIYNGSDEPAVVSAGDRVQGEVRYNNVGTTGLRGVIIKVKWQGLALDPESLEVGEGSYDPVKREVSWSAASVPELAVVQPQQGGSIPFSFTIRKTEDFPLEGEGAKNNIVVSTATVDSPDLPTALGEPKKIFSDRAVISVRTSLTLQADAFYDDGRLGITSTGPLPPEVGKETSYTVRFRVGTSLNDVSGVRLEAVVPDGVRYTGQNYKTNGEIQFDERTGRLIWTMPYIEGLIGRARPPEELHIQVAVRPGEDRRGEIIKLLKSLTCEATDEFVDQAVSNSLEILPSTETAVLGKGSVK